MKRIAICDDEIGTCSDLEKMILDFANHHALRMETEVFYSGETFYRKPYGFICFTSRCVCWSVGWYLIYH